MKLTLSIVMFLFFQLSFSQTIFGKWKTIDDITGKEKGVVEIFEHKGKVYGRIIEIFEAEKKHIKCEKCDGDEKNKPVMGMNIIKGMTKDGDIYGGGKVLDPKIGKWYHCKISLDGKDKLIVRGYIGIPLFGRSQIWIRHK
ncbi:DUF2147 domain-containing protein [Flavobacterium sangjuense]|uniref:DUF2147 domain-containing protein n=1 Tax=Flavobacterium sangjuense TaxID=2518177 RepID=A0A4P7PWN2_9FLAO|nr:DUF2147 domain-containing protein [Flavobacterium sangjuense]QBZ98393.1 hypothetical protein GS03_01898 [Flavobacterium sangjuense]